MSDAAKEMLRKMKEEKASPVVPVKPEDFYSRLMISKSRRRGLMISIAFFFVALLFVIFSNRVAGGGWLVVCSPVLLIGFLITLLPPTEEWVYKPWQAKPQQYERHITER